MEQSRIDLKAKFSNGKRPDGPTFGELIDSFINTKDDNIKKDVNGNFIITVGDIDIASAGTIRFHDSKIQYFDGGSWQDVGSGSGGGFKVVPGDGGNPEFVNYNNGRVGIGTGGNPPTAKLEVGLAANEQVKIGNAGISNGARSFNTSAQFSHTSKANNDDFALRQAPDGNVFLNAPADKKINLTLGGTDIKLCIVPPDSILPNGAVVVGSDAGLGHAASFQVNGDIFVSGIAYKNAPGEWNPSDVRTKEDIKPFTDGLEKVLQIKPVKYKYNGKAHTQTGQEHIGIIGQEIATVLPYTVTTDVAGSNENGFPSDTLLFNPNAIQYILINAVKELSAKVDELQNRLLNK